MSAAIVPSLENIANATELERAERWYAAYTCVRHEKKVAEQLASRNVDHYLPLYRAMHRWNQRKVEVELPLFPGYVFVRIPLRDRLRVLTVPSVVHLVGSGGRPVAVEDEEIGALRRSLAICKAEPHPYLAPGRRVRVNSGPLEGLQGVITRVKGKWRMVVSVDCIAQSLALEIDSADLESAS